MPRDLYEPNEQLPASYVESYDKVLPSKLKTPDSTDINAGIGGLAPFALALGDLDKTTPLVEAVLDNPAVVEKLAETNLTPVREWRVGSTHIKNPA